MNLNRDNNRRTLPSELLVIIINSECSVRSNRTGDESEQSGTAGRARGVQKSGSRKRPSSSRGHTFRVFAPHEIRITPVSSSSLFLFFLFLTLYSFRLSDTSASLDILHRFLYLFRREIAIFSFLFLLSFFISYATRKRVDRIVQSFVCPSNVCFCCMRGI